MSPRNLGNAPVVVDLFAGAGGLSEGLLQSGLHVAASVELHPQAGLTHAFNHPATDVLVGDIRSLDHGTLDRSLDRQGVQRVDVVVGGPPCQGFSSAGKKSLTDPRNSLFRSYIRVIEHLRPRMFVMENVPGFKRMYGGAIFAEAQTAFTALGYRTIDTIMAAADYGVPQTRKRFVMVGWDDSVPGFAWPVPTHLPAGQPDHLFAQAQGDYVTAGDALGDIDFLEPGFEATAYHKPSTGDFAEARRAGNVTLFNHLATRHRSKAVELFRRIPVGGSIRDLPSDERGTKKLTMTRLTPTRISNTIVSLPDDILHYLHNRILTVRECARLQTFDDDFVFIGKRTSGFVERRVDVPQYTQVGNAVPPLLGAALGRSLLSSLGAEVADLRDVATRRARHALVCGSSAYAGYTLLPEAKGEVVVRTVGGESLGLPILDESEMAVLEQEPLRDWTKNPNPRRGQWAPGVASKDRPNWVAVS